MSVKERARKRGRMEGESREAQRGREGHCEETSEQFLGRKCKLQNKKGGFGNAQLICKQTS